MRDSSPPEAGARQRLERLPQIRAEHHFGPIHALRAEAVAQLFALTQRRKRHRKPRVFHAEIVKLLDNRVQRLAASSRACVSFYEISSSRRVIWR